MSKHEYIPKPIEQFLMGVQNSSQPVVRALRTMILDASTTVSEELEWFTLAYFCQAKERKLRKKDFLTLSQYKDSTLLVFPDASRYDDVNDILEGKFKDGRKLVRFAGMREFQEKKPAVKALIDQWTNLVTAQSVDYQ